MAQQLAESVGQVHSRHYQRPSQLLGEGPVAVVGSGNSALQIAADIATTGRPVYLAFDERTPKAPNNTLTWLFLKATRLLRFSRHGLLGAHIYSRPEPVVSGDLKRVQRMPNVHEIGRALAATARTIQGKRGTTPDLDAVVWATGFGPDFRWIDLPVLNQDGHPEHQRGLSSLPGLAFLGLPWLDSRGSALMGGIRHDAQRVVNALIAS
jgi:putative flavoprotein involved in K+ transport